MRIILKIGIVVVLAAAVIGYIRINRNTTSLKNNTIVPQTTVPPLDPFTIEALRQRSYPGSEITIEATLPDGSNYHQYLTSYQSDGLKIYALLTIPMGNKPKTGWPVILFNHGYIPPTQYETFPSVGQYASYYPVFSREGYIVFKPDYRGNGNSEGKPEGAYYSPAYVIDDLNALSSIQKYKDADPARVGVWGHSMGGNITLRDIVIRPNDVKAAVIWGGVVGSYDDIMNNWQRRVTYNPGPTEMALRISSRAALLKKYGTPKDNPTYWNSVDPTAFLQDITAPVQIHTGADDEEVPATFSQSLYDNLNKIGKNVEFYSYPGDNHNISANFNTAMRRSLEFFDAYLK